MPKKRVIHTFSKQVDEVWFEVEYLDANDEWISAAGGWQGHSTIQSSYTDKDAAMMVAKDLRKTHGHFTRVVEVTP